MTQEKRCPMCQSTKPASEFFKNVKNGLSSYCKPCSAERKRKGEKTRAEITESVYPSETTKICSKCGAEKNRSQFNERVRDGRTTLRPDCKECQHGVFKNWVVSTGKQKFGSRAAVVSASVAITYPQPGMKLCRGCGTVKEADSFGSRFTGGICKECRSIAEASKYATQKVMRTQQRADYRANNLDRLREYARNGYKRRRAAKLGVEATLTTNEWLGVLEKYGHKCLRCGTTKRLSQDHVVPISKGGPHSVLNIQPLCVFCNSSKGTKTIDYRTDMTVGAMP